MTVNCQNNNHKGESGKRQKDSQCKVASRYTVTVSILLSSQSLPDFLPSISQATISTPSQKNGTSGILFQEFWGNERTLTDEKLVMALSGKGLDLTLCYINAIIAEQIVLSIIGFMPSAK